ncbi:MAG: dockerin type I repeat-containing protein [Oscillospiraceae bacterium]|nr:dockerin type I repeat-containing protein [Oscillospiraceae bacterium]
MERKNKIVKKRRTICCFVIIVALLLTPVFAFEGALPEATNEAYKERFEIGAEPGEMISFGGIAVNSEYGLFTTNDNEGICLNGNDFLPDKAARLNYLGGNLYYISDGCAYRFDLNSNEKTFVFSEEESIRQFYVVNGEDFWYLTDSGIYLYKNGEQNEVLANDKLFGFTPTPFGLVYAEGDLFDYSIFAGERLLAEHSSSFSVDFELCGGSILFETDGSSFYITLEDAFSGSGIPQEYRGYAVVDADELFSGLTEPDEEGSQSTVKRTAQKSYRKTLSTGVQNIVRRAYQMTNIRWTPQKNITGWDGGLTYYAGRTYTGLPYGQPVDASYVPWTTSLPQFVSYVNDPNSKMYTSYASYNCRAPYYSVDCSAFVSWAWNLGSRQTTATMHNYATLISSSSYANMQVADCFCKAGSHVVLVTDMTYDANGVINGVEISEATVNAGTNYCCQKTWYGTGYSQSLSKMQSKYLGDGYILYRSNTRENVSYTHYSVVVLDDDVHSDVLTSGTPATCINAGQNVYTCSVCGRSRTETIPATGHSFGDWVVTVQANCIMTGLETRTCIACGAQETRTLPAGGHSYLVTTVAPNCTQEGYDLHNCAYCGDQYTDNVIPAAGHRFSAGICTVCGAVDESIPKGDVNLDGIVSSADAVLLARYLVDAAQISEAQSFAADLNNDNLITSADAVLLARLLVA